MQRNSRGLEVLVLVDVELAEILIILVIKEDAGVVVIIVVIIVVNAVLTEPVRQVIAQAGRVIIVIIIIVADEYIRAGIDFRRIVRLIAIPVIIIVLDDLFRRVILVDGFKFGLQTRVFALRVKLIPTLRTAGRPASEIVEFGAAAGAGALASQFRLGHDIPT